METYVLTPITTDNPSTTPQFNQVFFIYTSSARDQ
jgi:hypothetical protein